MLLVLQLFIKATTQQHANLVWEAIHLWIAGSGRKEGFAQLVSQDPRKVPLAFIWFMHNMNYMSQDPEEMGFWILMVGLSIEIALYNLNRALFFGWRMIFESSCRQKKQLLTF